MDNKPIIRPGESVMIWFNNRDIRVVPGMLRYNGIRTEVAKAYNSQYECKDVESESGIPYVFTRDMLISGKELMEKDKREAYYG